MRPKMRQIRKILRKTAPRGPNMAPKGGGLKVWMVSAQPPLAPKKGFEESIKTNSGSRSITPGRGNPAHCDASRISAGVPFRDYFAAGINSVVFAQSFPQFLPHPLRNWFKSSQDPPKIYPKSTPNRPKSGPEGFLELFWSPCGAHA